MAPENPAAFPTHHKTEQMTEDGYRDAFYSTGGMTLRDHFAAAALTGLLANSAPNYNTGTESAAHLAYFYADAMLTEREVQR